MADNSLILELQKVGQQIVDQMRRTLAQKNANATGNLSNSIKSKVTQPRNNVTTLEIEMDDYGPILDEGRGKTRPGTSSGGLFFANLKQWVGIKLGLTGKQQIKATFAVYKKINKRGYRPKPFIQSSINTVLRQNEKQLSDAAFRVLANQIESQFKNIQKKL
jgi:16S rRNA A1518/A1519 N6-dimethyltransferase RsmA/KsgA/DIM1 with predicted DNA glycosylase/AP lyase activity